MFDLAENAPLTEEKRGGKDGGGDKTNKLCWDII